MSEFRPPTNKWGVLKIACICVAACFIANCLLAAGLRDFSEVRGGGLGALMSVAGLILAKRGGII